jgi:hypothetical protein
LKIIFKKVNVEEEQRRQLIADIKSGKLVKGRNYGHEGS